MTSEKTADLEERVFVTFFRLSLRGCGVKFDIWDCYDVNVSEKIIGFYSNLQKAVDVRKKFEDEKALKYGASLAPARSDPGDDGRMHVIFFNDAMYEEAYKIDDLTCPKERLGRDGKTWLYDGSPIL